MRFTVTEFSWPFQWFAVWDAYRQCHIGSYAAEFEAKTIADYRNSLLTPQDYMDMVCGQFV